MKIFEPQEQGRLLFQYSLILHFHGFQLLQDSPGLSWCLGLHTDPKSQGDCGDEGKIGDSVHDGDYLALPPPPTRPAKMRATRTSSAMAATFSSIRV